MNVLITEFPGHISGDSHAMGILAVQDLLCLAPAYQIEEPMALHTEFTDPFFHEILEIVLPGHFDWQRIHADPVSDVIQVLVGRNEVALTGISLGTNQVYFRKAHLYPELAAQHGRVIHIGSVGHEFTENIRKDFEKLCDEQLKTFSQGEVTGYEYVFRQDLPWNRKLEKRLKNIGLEKIEN